MSNYICPCCGAKYEIKAPGTYQCECGKEFTITPAQTPKKNICPFCKSELHPEAVKCSHCGEWLSQNGPPKSKGTYLLLAFFFGPLAEFYLGNFIGGLILLIFESIVAGALLSSSGMPLTDLEFFSIAGFIQLIYFLYACFVDVNPAPVNPAQQNKKSSGGIMWFCWIIIIFIVIGIAVAYFIANRPS